MTAPSHFGLRRKATIPPHDVFATSNRRFVVFEFDVEAVAILVRPAGGYLRPDVLVEIPAPSDNTVKLVRGWAALGFAVRVRR